MRCRNVAAMSRVDPARSEPSWLNVASSTCVEPGFVNLDNHVFLTISGWPRLLTRLFPARYRASIEDYRHAASQATLVRHNCQKPLPYSAKSVDHILCSHFLEHVYPDEARAILEDFRRVLKPGGTLHIIVPDIERMAHDYLSAKDGGDAHAADRFIADTLLTARSRGTIRFRILEAVGGFGLIHRWMYDDASIRALVADAGFVIDDSLATPSDHVRNDDGISIHLRARRP